MKKRFPLVCLLLPLAGFGQRNLKLWYEQPAKVWTEALKKNCCS